MIRNERLRSGRVAVGLTLCLFGACAPDAGGLLTLEGPQDGTETGNPPIIDSQRIALVVSEDALRVVGSPGAVTPGGTAIAVLALSTKRAFDTTSASDGSFDVQVEGPLAETFEVRAAGANASSAPVYVLRGGASVTGVDDGALSCDDRSSASRTQMEGAASAANKTCSVSADCRAVSLDTDCFHGCSSAYVSAAGEAQLAEARAAIEGGLCAEFASDGCRSVVPPCVPTSSTPRCVDGQCVATDGDSFDCTSDFDPGDSFAVIGVYWFNAAAGVCEPRTYGGTGGNGNRYASSAECIAACAPGSDPGCPPDRVWASACIQPGIAGGCGAYELKCAVVCPGNEACASGEYCNQPQGFCEAFGI